MLSLPVSVTDSVVSVLEVLEVNPVSKKVLVVVTAIRERSVFTVKNILVVNTRARMIKTSNNNFFFLLVRSHITPTEVPGCVL